MLIVIHGYILLLNKITKNEKLLFLKRVLKNPKALGAVMPSSKALGQFVCQHVNNDNDVYVVEVGAGTGSLTKTLLESGLCQSKLIVIELDPELTQYLREKFPHITIIQGDATNLLSLLPDYTHGNVTTIISGIPLMNLNKDEQKQLFDAFRSVMNSEGKVIQFTYGPTSPLCNRRLGINSSRLGLVLKNVPPATVWSYTFASINEPVTRSFLYKVQKQIAKFKPNFRSINNNFKN